MTENTANHSLRTHCVRCGECCARSSPTLHRKDLPLVREGFIRMEHLYTLRKGEGVRDNVHERLIPADQEMIKVREKKGGKGDCIFYDETEKACAIYDNRPAQCASLKCWDTAEFLELYKTPRLQRRDLIEDGVLLALMEEHDNRCGYAVLHDHVRRIPEDGGDSLNEILEVLKFDFHLRPFMAQKLGMGLEEMDFFFGRPLTETIVMFGLKVKKQPEGGFFLTRLDSGRTEQQPPRPR